MNMVGAAYLFVCSYFFYVGKIWCQKPGRVRCMCAFKGPGIGGNLWELDRTVERAMDALRVPPDDAEIAVLSGERWQVPTASSEVVIAIQR